jgi:hypothetical protein
MISMVILVYTAQNLTFFAPWKNIFSRGEKWTTVRVAETEVPNMICAQTYIGLCLGRFNHIQVAH